MTPQAALEILYADDRIVAVNKPAGLASIPGRGESDSVIEQLARQLSLPCSGQTDPRIRVVHRLDKDTSGVLLFAKDISAQRHLSYQFQNNSVAKEYLALVVGRPEQDEGEIDAAIGPHSTQRERMTITKAGRPARTLWRVEKRFRAVSLLRVFPKTGKTHQIRVHLRSIGLPLAIDPVYNPAGPAALLLSAFKRGYRAKRQQEERPLIARLTLHAQKIRFIHPDGREMELSSSLPKDFRSALNMLTKYG